MKKQLSSTEVKKLQEELDLYNMNLKDDDRDANAHYMKARTLYKLGKFNDKCYKQAEESYKTALDIEDNPLYHADLAKLYSKMHKKLLASNEIKEAKEYEETTDVTGIYIKNTINEVELELANMSPKEEAEIMGNNN